ncbi:phage tail protein [Archangium violaceum]|uniref:phage tail protein n=1 Tax=Archangium violaceum TaxID=83451 RepID=UPI00193BC081|nr:phage tail protein [Archangium violaceum]QRK06093.1 phage tail protein [Archangium violaceum]
MPEFTKNAKRVDPYKNFKFVVSWDGKPVAGVSKVSALKRTTEVVKHRAGSDPSTTRKSLGQTDWEAITLERGVTHDTAFEQWANKVWDYANSSKMGQEVSLADFRKDLTIDLFNEAGQKVISYKCYRCWPSEFTAMPELDGSGNAVAIQSLVLQTEGWERDQSVQEPQEPTFNDPTS